MLREKHKGCVDRVLRVTVFDGVAREGVLEKVSFE